VSAFSLNNSVSFTTIISKKTLLLPPLSDFLFIISYSSFSPPSSQFPIYDRDARQGDVSCVVKTAMMIGFANHHRMTPYFAFVTLRFVLKALKEAFRLQVGNCEPALSIVEGKGLI